MEVRFRTATLATCAADERAGRQRWGKVVARAYIRRVRALGAAETVLQVRRLPGRFHALAGQRRGQYAIALDQGWRLILTFGATRDTVIVEEVTNHYAD